MNSFWFIYFKFIFLMDSFMGLEIKSCRILPLAYATKYDTT